MTERSIRRLDCQTSKADNHAWALIGLRLRNRAVEILGYHSVVDVPLINVIDGLVDKGHGKLAIEISGAVERHNAEGLIKV